MSPPKTLETNPLIGLTADLPFDAIRAEHVEPAVVLLLERAQAAQAAIVGAPLTWSGTAGALDALTADLETTMGVVEHLESVLEDPALRTAHDAVRPLVSAFYADLALDSELYAALKAFAETEEAQALDPVRKRYLTETLAEFRRGGADLPIDRKAELRALEVELAQVTSTYAHHVVDATDAWSVVITEESRLAGLPERSLAAAAADARQNGVEGWRFTLRPPSFTPVLQFGQDVALREQVWRAYNSRATRGDLDNRPLLAKILELRGRKAHLLGYRDVSDLFLEARMARRGDVAARFVDDLRIRTLPFFERDRAELLAFRGESAAPLRPWDVGFLAEMLRQERYDFDAEALRPWFPVDGVMGGLFALVSKLYGVTVRQVTDRPTWHPDVRVYVLEEAGRHIGTFYADLFPRAGKRGGAWMRPLFTGSPQTGGAPHVGLICGNFTPPLGDQPALLNHQEVETAFHEVGHLLHHLFTEVPVRGLSGTNVAWDFVELPSQIMENWAWERPALDLFARHHETGETLPEALFERMRAARNFRSGDAQMRQLGFAALDLTLHRDHNPEVHGDVVAHALEIQQQFSSATLPDDFALVASFTHLFAHPTGYAAAYYSYKWAEVLDADAFSRFQAAGLFSAEEGNRFRRMILAKGSSVDPAELFREFMGREPNPEALMARAGLV